MADLHLELHPGETVALLGPNGAGKSSTLDLLLGLRTPDTGSVSLFGTTPQRHPTGQGRRDAPERRPDGGRQGPELVRLARDLHPHGYPVDQIPAAAGITDIADRVVGKLSGGQEQRVRFARPPPALTTSSCWTSPPPAWTSPPGRRSGARCAARPTRAARSSSPRTIWKRPTRSPTG
ncbi:ATP-binding cassette domain-containing protein [Streptomyces albulus]|nr:ATP-binding cassette domain-containing protein [Streptomyces noursei]